MRDIRLNDIVIRTSLKPGDIGYVTYMHGKLYQDEYQYGIGFEAYVAKGLCEFYAQYDELLDRVWVAEHAGGIVGFLLLMHREPGEAQLRYFILDPEYRGIGLGKKMSLLYMEHLQNKGYTRSYLWTTHELYNAADIYRKMGFVLTEEVESESFGKSLKEQRYDLVLKNN
jgi:ribosomal protein S18 acetylase RimI-like enzyme